MSDTDSERGSTAEDPGTSQGEPPEPAGPGHLRAETAHETAEPHGQDGRRRQRGGRWRAPAAVVLIVLGRALAPISVIGVWGANQVSTHTGRYIANIEPLIHEPPIQNALTGKVTTAITSHLDVTGYADQASAALTGGGHCPGSARRRRASLPRSLAASPGTRTLRCTRS